VENTISNNNANAEAIAGNLIQIDVEIRNSTRRKKIKRKRDDDVLCPEEKQAKYELFPKYCKRTRECANLGTDFRCCRVFGSKRCVEGIPKPLPEPVHERE
jgi:hypothetical protein